MSRKLRFMKPLTSSLHLYTAMAERVLIVVFNGDEMIGAGQIAEVTEISVKIGDERYMREVCTCKYAAKLYKPYECSRSRYTGGIIDENNSYFAHHGVIRIVCWDWRCTRARAIK